MVLAYRFSAGPVLIFAAELLAFIMLLGTVTWKMTAPNDNVLGLGIALTAFFTAREAHRICDACLSRVLVD